MKKRYYNQLTTEEFIKRARAVHGDKYDYSKVEYVNSHTKVCIICPEHGEFWQTPSNHMRGKTCKVCAITNKGVLYKNRSLESKPYLWFIPTPRKSKAVPLTKGRYALVDEEDYDRVMEHNWHLTGAGYANNNKLGLLHRFLLDYPENGQVDHVNRCRTDCRKSNLRVVDTSENSINRCGAEGKSSKYKGVSFIKTRNKWKVQLRFKGKHVLNVSTFEDEKQAALFYDEAAKAYYGENAHLNFPYGADTVYCSPCRYIGLIKE